MLLLFVVSIMICILMIDNIHIKMLSHNIDTTNTNNERSGNSEHTDQKKGGKHDAI